MDASGSGYTSSGSGTINLSSSSAKTFSGGGFSYPTLNQGGSGAMTIDGSNTFADITNSYASTGSTTITFTAGTTQTVTQFSASGSSGKQLILNSSSAGTRYNLLDSSGTNSVSYTTISDSHAYGGAKWNSFISNGNVDGGDNFGWDFSYSPISYNGFSLGYGFSQFAGLSIKDGLSVKR